VNWLKEVQKYWTNDTGWVYGITCEDIPFYRKKLTNGNEN